MTEKTFKTVGYSTRQGVLKLRFTNDKNRVKVLERKGHEDINLYDLPEEMDKESAARWLHSKRGMNADVRHLINQFLTSNQDEAPAAVEQPKKARKPKEVAQDEPKKARKRAGGAKDGAQSRAA